MLLLSTSQLRTALALYMLPIIHYNVVDKKSLAMNVGFYFSINSIILAKCHLPAAVVASSPTLIELFFADNIIQM